MAGGVSQPSLRGASDYVIFFFLRMDLVVIIMPKADGKRWSKREKNK